MFTYIIYFLNCCDGSDEWNSGVECPNICQAQGEKWREEFERSRLIQRTGFDKRIELSKLGVKQLEEKKTELEKQKVEFIELEPLKISIETKKNAAEEREREAKEKHDSVWNGK